MSDPCQRHGLPYRLAATTDLRSTAPFDIITSKPSSLGLTPGGDGKYGKRYNRSFWPEELRVTTALVPSNLNTFDSVIPTGILDVKSFSVNVGLPGRQPAAAQIAATARIYEVRRIKIVKGSAVEHYGIFSYSLTLPRPAHIIRAATRSTMPGY